MALRKPLSRALYLLKLVGFGIDLADNHAMPAEFLMEQMEWREAVAEARAGKVLPALEDLDQRVRVDIRKGTRNWRFCLTTGGITHNRLIACAA